MPDVADHRAQDLSAGDRARLEAAHVELRAAVQDYEERFLGGRLTPDDLAEVPTVRDLAAAQGRVEVAERRLWDLREKLLGWSRPSWVPDATMTAEWFSDEDSVYDADHDLAQG